MPLKLSIFVFALTLCQVVLSQNTTTSANSLPPCLQGCSNKAALGLKCLGATDYKCICGKEQFMINSAKCLLQTCPDLAANTTLTTASFTQLASSCKSVTGNFNLTVPTAAMLGLSNTTSSTNKTSTSASTKTVATSTAIPTHYNGVSSNYIVTLAGVGACTFLASVTLLM